MKLMRWLVSLLLLYQVFFILNLLRVDTGIKDDLGSAYIIQMIFSLGWILAFSWCILGFYRQNPQATKRSLWLVCGFVLYAAARLALFAQADYDSQRIPFIGVISGIILAALILARFVRTASKKLEHHDGR